MRIEQNLFPHFKPTLLLLHKIFRVDISSLLQRYEKHQSVNQLLQSLNQHNKIKIKNLHGSSKALVSAALFKQNKQTQVIMLPEKEDASYFYYDLVQLIGDENALYFPSSYKRSVVYKQTDAANVILRTEVLNKLSQGEPFILVTYPEAAVEKVTRSEDIKGQSHEVKTGDKLDISFLTEVLDDFGFERVDFVFEPGQYALRGGIMDIFSFSSEYPVRVDFFGDEIESIRTFDTETQLSIQKREKVTLLPDLRNVSTPDQHVPLYSVLPENTTLWFVGQTLFADRIQDIKDSAIAESEADERPALDIALCDKEAFMKTDGFKILEVGMDNADSDETITFPTAFQPRFQKNFERLFEFIQGSEANGFETMILSNSEKQLERLHAIFDDSNAHVGFIPVTGILHEGFTDHELQVNVFTDHQIFERYHRVRLRTDRLKSGNASLSLKEINQLNPGDYVVHSDHGVGKFGGLARTDINGKEQEVIKLIYKDNDVLFVSIHSLHRISKFKGKDAEPPKVNKLGTGEWQKMNSTAKSKVKDIARYFLKLYAKRLEEKGFAFAPDTYLQREL